MGRRARRRSRRTLAHSADSEAFEPPIQAIAELPAEVVSGREEESHRREQLDAVLSSRIDGHLLAYQTLLDELIEAHRGVADTMDFGLGERTRWTAIWELSGRCLGLCNCLLAQLRAGFASETVPTLRAIHEAGQLLSVLAGPGEEAVLRQWLDDREYIKASKARAAEMRINKPVIAEMKMIGIELKGDQAKLGSEIYDHLSKPAHNMRRGFAESLSVPLRQFSYGPHPDPGQRAIHVEYGGQALEEIIMRTGIALATRFLGPEFYANTIQRLLRSLRAIRDEMPLNPPTVRKLRESIE